MATEINTLMVEGSFAGKLEVGEGKRGRAASLDGKEYES